MIIHLGKSTTIEGIKPPTSNARGSDATPTQCLSPKTMLVFGQNIALSFLFAHSKYIDYIPTLKFHLHYGDNHSKLVHFKE